MLSSAIADHLHVVPGVSTCLGGETRSLHCPCPGHAPCAHRTCVACAPPAATQSTRSAAVFAQAHHGGCGACTRWRRATRAGAGRSSMRPCLCGFREPCARLCSWGVGFGRHKNPQPAPLVAHPLGRFNVLIPGFLQLPSHKHPRRTVFFQKPWAVSTFLGRVLGFLLISIQIIKILLFE